MEKEKSNIWALLPIFVFLVLFLGMGIVTRNFSSMPAIVAFLIALVVAFIQFPKTKFEEKLAIVSKGIGDDNIITMCLFFWQQEPFQAQ